MFGISIQLSIFNGQTLWKWWEPENAFPPSPLPARENSTWEFQSLRVYGCLTVYNWSFLLTKLKPNRQNATKNKLLRKAPECPFNDYRRHLSSHCRLGERHWSLHGHDREMHFVHFRVHCVKCCGVACRYKKMQQHDLHPFGVAAAWQCCDVFRWSVSCMDWFPTPFGTGDFVPSVALWFTLRATLLCTVEPPAHPLLCKDVQANEHGSTFVM